LFIVVAAAAARHRRRRSDARARARDRQVRETTSPPRSSKILSLAVRRGDAGDQRSGPTGGSGGGDDSDIEVATATPRRPIGQLDAHRTARRTSIRGRRAASLYATVSDRGATYCGGRRYG
jgi:hypothetical protein